GAICLCKKVEDVRQSVRPYPHPIILYSDGKFAVRALRCEPYMAAFFVVLRRVVEKIGNDLGKPGKVSFDRYWIHWKRDCEVLPAGLNEGTACFYCAADDVCEVNFFLSKDDLPLSDARHIEQVINKPCQVLDLTLDYATHLTEMRISQPETLHQLDGIG